MRATTIRFAVVLALTCLSNTTPGAVAQDAGVAAIDTLTLGALHEAALRRDARARQAALDESALELRLRNLAAEWLPRLRVRGEARYQSDVPSLGSDDGGPGVPFSEPPKERYEAAVGIEQTLYDGGTIPGRRAVERARTDEARSHLTVALYELRREVDRAYFAALVSAARADESSLLIEDLRARLAQARSGVEAGVRLAGEAAEIEAELLRAGQRLEEYRADRRAALGVLRNLTGVEVSEASDLPVPELAADVSAVRADPARRHPAFQAFRGTATRLAREANLVARERFPRAVAFGEAGYGRPGLNQFADSWDTFWLGGVRLEWAPWRWGSIGREQEILELRREAIETEEDAFEAALVRAATDDLADIERLRASLATDDQILRLRAQVHRQEERRFEEGVITAAEYIDVRTALSRARVTLRLHRIELAAAQARYLMTLGVPIP
ncbi:MAG: TolC family protein [Gemmatimonadota bacterium]